jgi:cell division initiation protein
MTLTPENIVDFPLKHAVRGYKVEQVDELLDRVADRIETLERELESTRAALAAAQGRLDEATETEATLKRTLVTAQRAAEDTVAEAHARAAATVAAAEEESESLLADARRQAEDVRSTTMQEIREAQTAAADRRAEIEARLRHLGQVSESFERSIRDHVTRHLRLLEEAPRVPDEVGAAGRPESESESESLDALIVDSEVDVAQDARPEGHSADEDYTP